MTVIAAWPVDVPSCFMPDSPSGGPKMNRLSFQTDSEAVPIERPRYSWAPEVYDVELAPLSRAQFKSFQGWYRVDLAYGINPFSSPHPVTGDPSVWKIDAQDPPYRVQRRRMPNAGSRGITVMFRMRSLPLTPP